MTINIFELLTFQGYVPADATDLANDKPVLVIELLTVANEKATWVVTHASKTSVHPLCIAERLDGWNFKPKPLDL